MSRFSYFPGCSLHGTGREYGESLQAVCQALAIELKEIEDWVCCGATPAHATDPEAAHLLGIWNLAHAAKMGDDPIVTGCASCFSRLRAVREELAERPDLVKGAPDLVGLPVKPEIQVLHIAQVLNQLETREKIKASVKVSLNGLPVACYYGCLLTRPPGAGAIDDAEDPHILEGLVRLAGAEPIDFPLRLDCCGASLTLPRPDLIYELTGKILSCAHDRGARAIIVSCPMCHSNLDFQQEDTARALGLDFRMPVLYLTQLIGLALGIPPKALGLQRHFVRVHLEDLLAARPAASGSVA